ncbi:MAG: hypothetical protein IPJ65_27900 [Archangiaceae bacterium]|nr:hypothetical protein [Archangiaceae bacterium]
MHPEGAAVRRAVRGGGRGRPARSTSPRTLFFLAGVTAPLAAQLLWLVSTRSLEPWWAQTWTFAVEHERAYPGFPFTRYLWPALAQQPTLFALALLGAVDAGRRREWLLVGSFATTLFSFAFARAPFPYALVPFAALAALFAARGVGWLFERSRPTALALLAVTVVHGAFGLFRDAAPSNRAQHEVLAKLNDLTAPTDPVWDSSGQASARPHVGFRYYTNALIHRDEATTLGQRIAAELRAAGCTATLRDARFEWLPEDARAFVTAHFQPVDGDLSLWGQRYPAEAPPQTFEAVRTGTYFVEPADAALTLDGRDLDAATFTLERGSHRVEYRGPPRELFILWLPANKARWRPDFSAKPRFSTVF